MLIYIQVIFVARPTVTCTGGVSSLVAVVALIYLKVKLHQKLFNTNVSKFLSNIELYCPWIHLVKNVCTLIYPKEFNLAIPGIPLVYNPNQVFVEIFTDLTIIVSNSSPFIVIYLIIPKSYCTGRPIRIP